MKYKQFKNRVCRLDIQPMLSDKRIKQLWRTGEDIEQIEKKVRKFERERAEKEKKENEL